MKHRLICVLSLAAFAACSEDRPTSPQSGDVTGTYRLASFDDQALPAPAGLTVDGVSRQLLAGSFVLNADGTCSWSETSVRHEAGQSSTEVRLAECVYQEGRAGRLSLQFVGGSAPAFLQGVFHGGNSIIYLDFHSKREYRRVQP